MKERLLRLWPLAIVVLAVAFQYRAPLFGEVYAFEDITNYFVPLYTAAARAMRLGQFPTWELGAWSGQPLVGDPQLAVFYPPNWLWLFVRPLRHYAWLSLVHAAIGAAGMWALARARGRSTAAAAVAALSLALGAFFVLELRHAMFVATTAWMPWLLCGIERLAARRRLDDVLWIALAAALAILAGGWSMLLFGTVVVAIYAVAALGRAADRIERARLAAALAAAAVLAVALAAIQIAPALAHARQSPRALGLTPELASTYAWPSWRYVLTLFLPTLYGDDAAGTYVGAPDQWELCGYGIGVVGGILVLASLFSRERRRERVALFIAILLACDLARGADGLLQPLLLRLPLFAALRCPARALYIYTLAAPILAADGFDALVAARPAWLRPLVVAALALELAVTFNAENPSSTVAAAEAHPAAIDWLRTHAPPGRTTNDVHLGQWSHNMGLRWGFESAGGYHSLPIWRYLHLLWIANHGQPYPHAQIAEDLTGQGLWTFDSPLVDLLSVSFIAAPRHRPITAAGFERVFTGDDFVDVWHNRDAAPRAFVVTHARVVPDEAAAARAIADPAFAPTRVAIVEEPIGLPPPDPAAPPPPPTLPTLFVREDPTSLRLEVVATRPSLVVLPEPWYPGWRATVDGVPTRILRVDYALRGLRLEPGRHQIAMELHAPGLLGGAAITLLAFATVAGLTLAGARRRRNRP
jgi:hypothetical protein